MALLELLEEEFGGRVFLTPSCTSALEVSFLLTISPGDEVIVPDYCFPSLPNAVILRGGIPVFVDVQLEDGNLDPHRLERALSSRTKAVAPIHYSGVSCKLNLISAICEQYGLYLIEDAAQSIGVWKLTGDLGCVSFHETKNVGVGEGGCLVVGNPALLEAAELMVDCGTTKAKYRRGESSGYDWGAVGTSALMSPRLYPELLEKLERLPVTTARRQAAWKVYKKNIGGFTSSKLGNGHIFWFFTDRQKEVKAELRIRGVNASTHYEPAHLTPPGRRYGRTTGCTNSTYFSQHIIRLPTDVSEERALEISKIVNEVTNGNIRRIQTQGSEQTA